MERSDMRHLPQAVHDAVLHLMETLVEAFPQPADAVLVDVQTEEPQQPFPRSVVELLVLDALQALSPMPATSIQVAAMVNRPHLEVRAILQALAMLATIEHPRKGYYRHRSPADGLQASARFAAQIAAICGPTSPHTKE